MSGEVLIMGFSVAATSVYNLCGLFGGFFPLIVDVIERQKLPANEKIEINKEYLIVKALFLPVVAFVLTAFAVAFETINTWLAALYLGASSPVLINRFVSAKAPTSSDIKVDQ